MRGCWRPYPARRGSGTPVSVPVMQNHGCVHCLLSPRLHLLLHTALLSMLLM